MKTIFAMQERVELLMPPRQRPGSVDFAKLYEDFDLHDDMYGFKLDPKLTAVARKLEIDFFKGRSLYTKLKRESCE